jgi:hypothetical protein
MPMLVTMLVVPLGRCLVGRTTPNPLWQDVNLSPWVRLCMIMFGFRKAPRSSRFIVLSG